MPELVMATVTDPFGEVEAEPVVVVVNGRWLRLELHDGTVFEFDDEEFAGARLSEHERARRAA